MNDAWTTLRSLDSENQLESVLAMPDHLRDAMWRVDSARLESSEAAGLVVAGMGGSAIGGDLAVAAFGDRLVRPLCPVRGYALPTWVTPEWLVLCSSYSGNTEETLACFEATEALGARRIVATTDGKLADLARSGGVPVIGIPAGLQPRAAVGYMLVVAAEAAASAGVGPKIHTELDSTAAHLESSRDQLAERAESLAGQLEGTIPVVYGSGLTAAVAYRWKCQLNENAKFPAFSSELPEADHNELVGWEGARDAAPMSAVLLKDRDQHPRERERFRVTASLIEPLCERVILVETDGESRTERLLSAIMLGDLVSLHLAARRGVDPSQVELIERLKRELGAP